MVLKSKVVLAVGAHPDDVELGCGGTLCQAARNRVKVIVVYMTRGEMSGSPEVRVKESIDAFSVLGVKEIHFGNFPDTEIPNSRESIDFLEQFQIKYKPDIVLTHTTNDIHQDHRQVGWLSISAFRNVPKVLSYETPRVNPATFSPTYFVDISSCIKEKWEALQCHLSQKAKRYLTYESMINLASFRGHQVNLVDAEAFEVLRYVEQL